jgi:ETFB lysine methyltransferase
MRCRSSAEVRPAGSIEFALPYRGRAISFLRPLDPQAILNALTDEQFCRDEQLPYGSEHWPASEALAAWLADNPLPPGRSVCDLGCGLGVLSALVSLDGAHLTASLDIASQGCRYTRANLRSHALAAPVVCADFRHPPFRRGFDIVMASDVLYEARWTQPVAQFIADHLLPGGFALVADPCRTHWPAFLSQARDLSLTVSIAHRATVNQGRTVVEIARFSPACSPATQCPPAAALR